MRAQVSVARLVVRCCHQAADGHQRAQLHALGSDSVAAVAAAAAGLSMQRWGLPSLLQLRCARCVQSEVAVIPQGGAAAVCAAFPCRCSGPSSGRCMPPFN